MSSDKRRELLPVATHAGFALGAVLLVGFTAPALTTLLVGIFAGWTLLRFADAHLRAELARIKEEIRELAYTRRGSGGLREPDDA